MEYSESERKVRERIQRRKQEKELEEARLHGTKIAPTLDLDQDQEQTQDGGDMYTQTEENAQVEDERIDEEDEERIKDEADALELELLGEGRFDLMSDRGGNLNGDSASLSLPSSRINFSNRVENDITRSEKKGEKKIRTQGRDDRATSEQVMDPRTRLILFKMLSSAFLMVIDGCLSTGKEANVYYARGSQGQEYAVKIFKTSILVFKDRDKYVSGEYRFRNGYCKSNPRKMVYIYIRTFIP